jgi:O-antigen/teichoic acid export membrane protein
VSSRKKNTLIHLTFSYLNYVIAFINGILIVPFYLSFIEAETYGAWLATGNILTWLTIADPGTSNVTIQRIAKSSVRNDQRIVGYQALSSIVLSFIACTICMLGGFLVSGYSTAILNLSDPSVIKEIQHAFSIAVVGVSIALFEYSIYAILQGLQQQFYTGMARILGRLVGITVSVILVINGFGIKSIAIGVLVTNSISLIINLVHLLRSEINLQWSMRYFKSYIKIFSLTFFSRVFSVIYENIDLILVSRFLNPVVVAQLEITRRPMRYLQGFLVAPSQSLMPTLSNYFGHNKPAQARQLIEKLLVGFFCIFFITGLGFMMFNETLITVWVGKQFFIGNSINTILSLGIVLTMFNYILSNINISLGNIRGTSYTGIVNSIVGLALLLTLGYFFGLTGLVIAPLISISACQLWYYVAYINRKVNLSINLRTSFVKIILFGSIIYYFVQLASSVLTQNNGMNYWPLIVQGIILIGGIFMIYIASITEFRALLFNDVLKFLAKRKQ